MPSASSTATAAAQTLAWAFAAKADFGIAPAIAASPITWMFGCRVEAKLTGSIGHQPVRSATPVSSVPPKLINTCYSVVAPDYGISIAGVYHPVDGKLVYVEGAGGTSPLDAPAESRVLEANLAAGWFRTITGEVFG